MSYPTDHSAQPFAPLGGSGDPQTVAPHNRASTRGRRWPWVALGFVMGGVTVPVALYGLLMWALSTLDF